MAPSKQELELLRKQVTDVELRLSNIITKESEIRQMQPTQALNAQKKAELNSLEIQKATHTAYLTRLQKQYEPLERLLKLLKIENVQNATEVQRLDHIIQNQNKLIEIEQRAVAESEQRIAFLKNVYTETVKVLNNFAEKEQIKVDEKMLYADAIPAEHLVHTGIIEESIKSGHNEAFKLALSKLSDEDINHRDSKGKTLLMYAAANAFSYGVEELLKRGAQAEGILDTEGYDALYYAAGLPHITCFKLIADKIKDTIQYPVAGSDTAVNILINNTYKVLFSNEFEQNQYVSLSDLLLNGALDLYGGCQTLNVNTSCTIGGMNGPRAEDGYTTAEDKILRMISFIADKDATVLNIKNEKGHTPLSISCSNKIRYLANQLLDKYGAYIDKNIKDINGIGYFTFGAHLRDTTFLQKLFDKNFDINTQDNEGNSALHWMARANYQWNDIAIWLIDHGINKDIQTNAGETPLIYASQNNNIELLNYLLTHGANHNIPTKQGAYPWHVAAYFGSLDALKILKSQVPDVDFPSDTPDKIPALYYAAKQGNGLVAAWLIREGADINVKLPSNHDSVYCSV